LGKLYKRTTHSVLKNGRDRFSIASRAKLCKPAQAFSHCKGQIVLLETPPISWAQILSPRAYL
jgi:hypothetical protein